MVCMWNILKLQSITNLWYGQLLTHDFHSHIFTHTHHHEHSHTISHFCFGCTDCIHTASNMVYNYTWSMIIICLNANLILECKMFEHLLCWDVMFVKIKYIIEIATSIINLIMCTVMIQKTKTIFSFKFYLIYNQYSNCNYNNTEYTSNEITRFGEWLNDTIIWANYAQLTVILNPRTTSMNWKLVSFNEQNHS